MKKLTFLTTSACLLLGSAALTQAQSLVGLGSGGASLSFYDTPSSVPTVATVTGLAGGESLIGIDYFSSSDGQLYGLGSQGNLYTLSTTGVAASITSNTALIGAQAIDFNPVANRLRIYNGTSTFRLTPASGGAFTADGTMSYAAGDVNAGAAVNLFAAAYSNNFAGATVTSLYSIDTGLNTLVLSSVPPGFATLNTVAGLTLGGVPFDATAGVTGFDILGANTAYFSNGNALFTVGLTDGALISVGTLGGTSVVDIAFAPVPEPSTYALTAIGALGLLVWLRRARAVLS